MYSIRYYIDNIITSGWFWFGLLIIVIFILTYQDKTPPESFLISVWATPEELYEAEIKCADSHGYLLLIPEYHTYYCFLN